jgi:hypothetical protein
MHAPRLRTFVAVLASVAVLAPRADAATSDPIQRRVAILADAEKDQKTRIEARDYLARRGATQELIALAKESDDERVRLHVAIALGRLRRNRSPIAENLDLVAPWLKAEDPALQYWAIHAVANARTAAAVERLEACLEEIGTAYEAAKKEVLEAQKTAKEALEAVKKAGTDGDTAQAKQAEASAAKARAARAEARAGRLEPLLAAMARALGEMGETVAADQRKALLLGKHLLGNKNHASLQVAGAEGLRLWRNDSPDVVAALFEVARTSDDEVVWRAAAKTLLQVARVSRTELMLFPPGIDKAKRIEKLKLWESEWKVQRREGS